MIIITTVIYNNIQTTTTWIVSCAVFTSSSTPPLLLPLLFWERGIATAWLTFLHFLMTDAKSGSVACEQITTLALLSTHQAHVKRAPPPCQTT